MGFFIFLHRNAHVGRVSRDCKSNTSKYHQTGYYSLKQHVSKRKKERIIIQPDITGLHKLQAPPTFNPVSPK